MPIIYQLKNPETDCIYYVGYTEKSIQERLIRHLSQQSQKTTQDLVAKGLCPIIEAIETGDNVTKETEIYWIQRIANQGIYLENRDGLINYQNRDYIYTFPAELLNTMGLSDTERYKAAIDLVLSEMPRSISVPIMIRIKAILEWAVEKK